MSNTAVPPNFKQIRYNVLTSLSTFFCTQAFPYWHSRRQASCAAVERRGIRFSGQETAECLVIIADTFGEAILSLWRGVLVGVFALVGLGLPKIFPGVKLTQSSVFRQRVYWASCVTSMTSIVWFMCLISRLRELDDWIDEILCSTSSLLVLPPNFMGELTSNGEIL